MDRVGRSAGWRGPAVVIAVTMLVAGCALPWKDPAPPVAAETAISTPSPSPTMPAAARTTSNAGAIAFVRYWFSVYNHATWTLTSAELTPISDSSCVFCNRAKQTVESLRAGDRRVEGGRLTVANVKLIRGGTSGMRLDCAYDQEASSILDEGGTKLSTEKAKKSAKMLVAVTWTGKQWTMLDVVILS